MEERKAPGIILYDSYFEQLDMLSAREEGVVLRALRQYFTTGNVSVMMNKSCRIVFGVIKHSIEADKERYERRCLVNTINGRKGGRPRKAEKEAEETTETTSEFYNNNNEDKIAEECTNAVNTEENETENQNKPEKPNNNINSNSNSNINSNSNSNNSVTIPQNEGSAINAPNAPEGDESELEAMFYEFWKAYPRKTGKKNALNVFTKLGPDKELFRNIMTSLEEQKKMEQWQSTRFIPHPSTWLYGRRWEDEICEDNVKASGRIDTAPTNISVLDEFF